MIKKIGFGGGCHWCTEAVFASLKGVSNVEQGWISSKPPQDWFSEAVIVHYDPIAISLKDLIEIHLYTHSSTSNHSMRYKYRSAIYVFDKEDSENTQQALNDLQPDFEQLIITQVLPFDAFKASLFEHINYYYSNPGKPFCALYIHPKLTLLRQKFGELVT